MRVGTLAYLAAFATFAARQPAASASCIMRPIVDVWPSGVLPANGIVVLWGANSSADHLRTMELRSPKLVSALDEVELAILDRFESPAVVTVVLKPVRELPVDSLFVLRYDELASAHFVDLNDPHIEASLPPTFRIVRRDDTPPLLRDLPMVVDATRVEYGCGATASVTLTSPAVDDGPVLYEVELTDLDRTKPVQRMLLIPYRDQLIMAQRRCFSKVEFQAGADYEVAISAMDAAGQRVAAPVIGFGAPAPELIHGARRIEARPVRVRVLDSSGRPIVGARVAAASTVAWTSTVTDRGGFAHFTTIDRDPIPLIASHERLGLFGDEIEAAHTVMLRAPSGVLRGRVVGDDAASRAGVEVQLRPGWSRPRKEKRRPGWVPSEERRTVTDGRGRFAFFGLEEARGHRVWVQSENGFVGAHADLRRVPREETTLVLRRGPLLRGRLSLGPEDGPLSEWRVTVAKWAVSTTTPVGPDGIFEIEGMSRGKWLLSARKRTVPARVWKKVELDERDSFVELGPPKASTLRVNVAFERGAPEWLVLRSSGSMRRFDREQLCGKVSCTESWIDLYVPSAFSEISDVISIELEAPGYVPVRTGIWIDPLEPETRTLLRVPAGLFGRVIDRVTGLPIPGAVVSLSREGVSAFITPYALFSRRGVSGVETFETAADGRYAFEEASKGNYAVEVHVRGFEPLRIEVELAPGSRALDLSMERQKDYVESYGRF
ncbi:MAG: carboxypeptidase regulatory-like domain-containing protein [Deltaproteobacteria bacterium]|nr:carboxypeptidase regulatory-like domain-containing protein [Deltaproteobacteria bacterium]